MLLHIHNDWQLKYFHKTTDLIQCMLLSIMMTLNCKIILPKTANIKMSKTAQQHNMKGPIVAIKGLKR